MARGSVSGGDKEQHAVGREVCYILHDLVPLTLSVLKVLRFLSTARPGSLGGGGSSPGSRSSSGRGSRRGLDTAFEGLLLAEPSGELLLVGGLKASHPASL